MAILFKLLGTSVLTLKLVPTLLYAMSAFLTWRAARRVFNSTTGQLAVPIVLWCAPAYGVWWSTKERGFYGVSILLVAAILLIVTRLADRLTRRDALSLGLCAGLGWWTSPLLALVFVPAALWLAVRRPRIIRLLPVLAVGALLGAAPWLAWNMRYGWASLQQPPDYFGLGTVDRLHTGLVKIPALVGFATPWDPDRTLIPAAGWVTALALAIGLGVATTRSRHRAPFLLIALLVGYGSLYPILNSTTSVGFDLRYLYLLLPSLSLLIGALIPEVQRERRKALVLAGVTALAAGTSWWGLVGLQAARSADTTFLAAPGLDTVIKRLEEEGVSRVTTDGAGTQITFATGGRIQASSFAVPRFKDLEEVSWVEDRSTYVLDMSSRDSDNSGTLERTLNARSLDYRREVYGNWVVYFLDSWLPPSQAGMRDPFGDVIPESNYYRDP